MNCVLRHKNRAWDGGWGEHKIHTWRGTLNIQVGWVEGGNFGFHSLIIDGSRAELRMVKLKSDI